MKADETMYQHETEVAGIPCIAGVTHYQPAFAGRGLTGEVGSYQDISPPEPEMVEFYLFDRKGYEAQWLWDKATGDDIERIESELLKARHEDY